MPENKRWYSTHCCSPQISIKYYTNISEADTRHTAARWNSNTVDFFLTGPDYEAVNKKKDIKYMV